MKLSIAAVIFCASLTPGQTLGELRTQIEWNPNNSLAHYQLGRLLMAEKWWQDAAGEFQRALGGDLQPPDIQRWAHTRLGEVFNSTGEIIRSLFEYREAERFKTGFDDSVLAELTGPRLVTRTEPDYSPEARLAGLEGIVSVMCEVGADGSVRNAAVTEQLGLGLDEQAVEAVKRWRFEPATLLGRPVARTGEYTLEFHLPAKQSRWHLVGASFSPEQGATRPEIVKAKYPIGSGITANAIDEGQILGAIGRLASVVIAFEVDEHGEAARFVVRSASADVWGGEAINLVRQWQFRPGTKEGVPVAVPCVLELVWGPRELPPQALRAARRAPVSAPAPR